MGILKIGGEEEWRKKGIRMGDGEVNGRRARI